MQQYFVTHGRGTEEFLFNELHSLKKAASGNDESVQLTIDDHVEGKVAFSTSLPVQTLLRLKIVERIFSSLLFLKFHSAASTSQNEGPPPAKNAEIAALLSQIDSSLRTEYFESAHFHSISDSYSGTSQRESSIDSSKRACVTKKYRINCKLTGKYRKLGSLRETVVENVSNKLKCINPYFEVSLEKPNFEIIVHLSEACLAMGIQVTQQPLSLRPYIKHVGLRSTICSIMIQLLEMNHSKDEHFLVLDPFCGKSTIFAEYFGMLNERSARSRYFLLGSDCSSDQLDASVENLSSSNRTHFNLLQANLLQNSSLPYRNGSIDVVVTDVPFGINHGRSFFNEKPIEVQADERAKENTQASLNANSVFYNRILVEFNRLLCKPEGFAIVLMNSKEEDIFEKTLEAPIDSGSTYQLTKRSKHRLSLGETNATLYQLQLVSKVAE